MNHRDKVIYEDIKIFRKLKSEKLNWKKNSSNKEERETEIKNGFEDLKVGTQIHEWNLELGFV